MSLSISGEILKHKSTPWSILWAWNFCNELYKSYETQWHIYIIFKTQFDLQSLYFLICSSLQFTPVGSLHWSYLFILLQYIQIMSCTRRITLIPLIWKSDVSLNLYRHASCSSFRSAYFQCWCWAELVVTLWLTSCWIWLKRCCWHHYNCQSLKISSYQYGPDRGVLIVD